jgi:hypothetical protein
MTFKSGEEAAFAIDIIAEFIPDTNRAPEHLRAAAAKLREQEAEIAKLRDPGFEDFVALARHFLRNYPPDIITGENGDPGECFAVRLRDALETLDRSR